MLAELALTAEVGITIDESELPIRPEVNGACEILGIDPIYVANEGKLIAVVAPDSADAALAALRSHPLGREAAIVGGGHRGAARPGHAGDRVRRLAGGGHARGRPAAADLLSAESRWYRTAVLQASRPRRIDDWGPEADLPSKNSSPTSNSSNCSRSGARSSPSWTSRRCWAGCSRRRAT